MDTSQLVVVAFSILVAVVAVAGALATWRVLARASNSMRHTAARLDGRAVTLSTQLIAARAQLAAADVSAERALWTLAHLDERMDRVTADLVASRAASDRLRVRLIEGRLTIARLRQLVRLAMRLGELRREFL